jgi:DNA-binding MarR family transcriptional regulator
MADSNDPAIEAWGLLWEVMQANKPRFMALAQELGLAPMQLHALRLIEPGVEVPMSSLAGKLFCDTSNVTGIVDRLVEDGLIVRVPVVADRRATLVRLTGKGRAEFSAMAERHEAWVNEILSALSDDEVRVMSESLDKLLRTKGTPADADG